MFLICSNIPKRTRTYPFDPAVAAAFLARVAAGERTAAVLDTPGAPSQRAYACWWRTESAFAAEMKRLTAARYWNRKRSGHPRWKAWDEPTADRVLLAVMRGAPFRRLLASDPALPCLAVMARWRRRQPDFDGALRMAMRMGRLVREDARSRARLTPALMEEIGERILVGGSLRSIGASEDMPCPATFYKWVARWPDFAAEVERWSHWRDVWLNDRIVDGALAHGPLGFESGRRAMQPLQRQLNRLAKRPGWKRAATSRAGS